MSYQIIIYKKSLYLSSPEPFFNENYGSSRIWRLHGFRLRNTAVSNTVIGNNFECFLHGKIVDLFNLKKASVFMKSSLVLSNSFKFIILGKSILQINFHLCIF